jgi:hypothetical protein
MRHFSWISDGANRLADEIILAEINMPRIFKAAIADKNYFKAIVAMNNFEAIKTMDQSGTSDNQHHNLF